jgi:hypothetical protein
MDHHHIAAALQEQGHDPDLPSNAPPNATSVPFLAHDISALQHLFAESTPTQSASALPLVALLILVLPTLPELALAVPFWLT